MDFYWSDAEEGERAFFDNGKKGRIEYHLMFNL
jgi:hypothetical protein